MKAKRAAQQVVKMPPELPASTADEELVSKLRFGDSDVAKVSSAEDTSSATANEVATDDSVEKMDVENNVETSPSVQVETVASTPTVQAEPILSMPTTQAEPISPTTSVQIESNSSKENPMEICAENKSTGLNQSQIHRTNSR